MSDLIITQKLRALSKRMGGGIDFIYTASENQRIYFINTGKIEGITIIYCPIEKQFIINSIEDYLSDLQDNNPDIELRGYQYKPLDDKLEDYYANN